MQWEEGANSQHWLPHLRHSTYLSACAALGLCLTWVSLNIPTPILLIRKQKSRKQWLAESKVQCDMADDFALSSKYGEKESERERKQLNIFGNIQKLTLTFFCNQTLVLQSMFVFFSIWINFLVMVHRSFVVPSPFTFAHSANNCWVSFACDYERLWGGGSGGWWWPILNEVT